MTRKVNRIITLMITISLLVGCKNDNTNKSNFYKNDKRVVALVNKMTLEEKIGQMCQINTQGTVISEQLEEQLKNGTIGSILNETEVKTINEIQRIAIEESRLGIPLLMGRDVIHGFKTIFPIPLGLAASWDEDLARKTSEVAATEARSSGINWTFAPMIDIARDARWGRIAESPGEDPYLASVMAAAMIKGFQGNTLNNESKLLACAKHFAGYGATEGGRDYNTTLIPENELRNVYLRPFHAATKAGVGSFMTGFNDLNGIPASGNRFLLKKVLRDEWNFKGLVVSDWASIEGQKDHGFVENEKEAAHKSLKAGVDMEMASTTYRDNIKNLLDEDKIDMKIIDNAVYNILKIKYDMGLFDNPYIKAENQNIFAQQSYLDLAKEAATKSIVLLKNNNQLLPIAKNKKIAVVGPMAHQPYEQLGTWIFDGDKNLSVTPLDGLKNAMGEENITFVEGLSYSRDKSEKQFGKAVAAARKSDAVIICVGEESILSGEAHCRGDIDLPGVQEALIKAIAKTNKPIVLLVLAGRPLTLTKIEKDVDAILYGFHPGTMTGAAVADLILGVAIPSAKLPVTFPKSSAQIPFYYNHRNTGRPVEPQNWKHIDSIPINTMQTSLGNTSHYLDYGYEPAYPFGFGLSYTEFEYSNLQIDKEIISKKGRLSVSVQLKNAGNYQAVETVQLYIQDVSADVTRPVRELKAFKKVEIKPGATKTVEFQLSKKDLSFYNQEMKWVLEPGKFNVWIGGSSKADLMKTFVVE